MEALPLRKDLPGRGAPEGLAEDYRLPIYLFYFQELSPREIAKALGIRPGPSECG